MSGLARELTIETPNPGFDWPRYFSRRHLSKELHSAAGPENQRLGNFLIIQLHTCIFLFKRAAVGLLCPHEARSSETAINRENLRFAPIVYYCLICGK